MVVRKIKTNGLWYRDGVQDPTFVGSSQSSR